MSTTGIRNCLSAILRCQSTVCFYTVAVSLYTATLSFDVVSPLCHFHLCVTLRRHWNTTTVSIICSDAICPEPDAVPVTLKNGWGDYGIEATSGRQFLW